MSKSSRNRRRCWKSTGSRLIQPNSGSAMLINLIQIEAAARSQHRPVPQPQTTFTTLARFFAKVYDDHVAPHGAKRALFEPRRVATPDGYHSTKCVGAGLYALLTRARLAAEDGELL